MNARLPRVFVDANILFSLYLRDLFIELDRVGAIITLWSAEVQREWIRNALEQHEKRRLKYPELKLPEWTQAELEQQVRLMDLMLPHANVTGFEAAIESIVGLKDPEDRHVVAAAVQGQADALISGDREAGFIDVLAEFGIDWYEADQFLVSLLSQDIDMAKKVVAAVRGQRKDYKRPPLTADELLAKFKGSGLQNFADLLAPYRAHF